MEKAKTKIDQLKAVLENHKTMLIVMQDNPDPDSIAAAVALRKLANALAEVQCSIAHSGSVGRGENRALVRYLGLNLRLLDQLDPTAFELFAMVDTQPGTGNNSLPAGIEPDIVIDHHPCRQRTRHCRFTDIRSHYGATVTILYEYFKAADIKIDTPLATAMLYAIRSDTQDLGRDVSRADIQALTELFASANLRMLSAIQRGKVRRDYFQMLSDALKQARVYGNAIVTNLGAIENADMIAEVADLLLRDDLTDWVMVYGFCQDTLRLSLRTEQERLSAENVMHRLVARKGTGGGHPSYAGGQISTKDLTPDQIDRLEQLITSRFLKAVVTETTKPQDLIRR
ncbi:MAG TPA: phosphoesterase [Phycisphaerales bacterium]|nr:phosphoesterase [Phycisphaerales bacterium]